RRKQSAVPNMKRREFITLLGGAAAAWPLAARAQPRERMRQIGVLLPATADNREFQARLGAFLQGLQQSGWSIGRNVQIDTRWATAKAGEIRRHAAELAALAPDVVLAHGASTVGPMVQATHCISPQPLRRCRRAPLNSGKRTPYRTGLRPEKVR